MQSVGSKSDFPAYWPFVYCFEGVALPKMGAYPGMAYECLNVDRPADNVTAMEQSCGSEDYAWTAEATTVTLIREIIGFREQLARDPGATGAYMRGSGTFALRPALPQRLLQKPGASFLVRGLRFRGVVFDVHYDVAQVARGAIPALLNVRVVESDVPQSSRDDSPRKMRSVSFQAHNAQTQHRIDFAAEAFTATALP